MIITDEVRLDRTRNIRPTVFLLTMQHPIPAAVEREWRVPANQQEPRCWEVTFFSGKKRMCWGPAEAAFFFARGYRVELVDPVPYHLPLHIFIALMEGVSNASE